MEVYNVKDLYDSNYDNISGRKDILQKIIDNRGELMGVASSNRDANIMISGHSLASMGIITGIKRLDDNVNYSVKLKNTGGSPRTRVNGSNYLIIRVIRGDGDFYNEMTRIGGRRRRKSRKSRKSKSRRSRKSRR